MTKHSTLDFSQVESLRKHMLLETNQMARVFGVSRMTYYNWVRGAGPSRANSARARATLKLLLDILVTHEWPTPDIIAMPPNQRLDALVKLMHK